MTKSFLIIFLFILTKSSLHAVEELNSNELRYNSKEGPYSYGFCDGTEATVTIKTEKIKRFKSIPINNGKLNDEGMGEDFSLLVIEDENGDHYSLGKSKISLEKYDKNQMENGLKLEELFSANDCYNTENCKKNKHKEPHIFVNQEMLKRLNSIHQHRKNYNIKIGYGGMWASHTGNTNIPSIDVMVTGCFYLKKSGINSDDLKSSVKMSNRSLEKLSQIGSAIKALEYSDHESAEEAIHDLMRQTDLILGKEYKSTNLKSIVIGRRGVLE